MKCVLKSVNGNNETTNNICVMHVFYNHHISSILNRTYRIMCVYCWFTWSGFEAFHFKQIDNSNVLIHLNWRSKEHSCHIFNIMNVTMQCSCWIFYFKVDFFFNNMMENILKNTVFSTPTFFSWPYLKHNICIFSTIFFLL